MTDYTFFYWIEMLLKEGNVLFIVLACLIVFFTLKKEIIMVLGRLNTVKLGDYEIKFKKEMFEIESKSIEVIKNLPGTNLVLPTQLIENFNIFESLASTQPNVAVLSAWRELELTAITLASKKGIEINGTSLGRASGIAALKNVQSANKISSDIVKLYEKTGESIKPISQGKLLCTQEDALAFCKNAKRLSNYLTSIF
ncbi:hypothetical protein M0K47_003511 [Escherichia coli]|uniref:Uncharacterized protein n=1 Tax=Escherichia albertii TaxID=208962 RepID=A0ABX5HAU6_ESCAL|nr:MULTISPECIES: hypothetical protein [Escherichia]EEY6118260.1 hypothetical protein [Escherichia coli]EFM9908887.1 hypothetical protein [Escherichia coli]EFO3873127.1 hypothetical protein [Escherichia coli]EGJ7468357.1 hypothetical protein [Escherichia coli]EHD5898166.1 hypothetical protein [Escherichia coli]